MSHVKLLPADRNGRIPVAGRDAFFLRNEIEPHFIINAFVRLPALIQSNPGEAIKFVNRLSSIYRDILQMRDKELVPLEKELDLFFNYTDLIKIDSGECIDIDLVGKPHSHSFILPISLQVLMENAVKHNFFSSEYPLHIRVSINEKSICFSNRIHRKVYPSFSGKTGLKNLDERYRLTAGSGIEIEKNEQEFTVKLPLIDVYHA